MDENQIRIIFNNFDELIKENRGLFKFFRKSKNPGLIKAIWSARDHEVSFLKERLNAVEKSNHERLAWLKSLKTLKQKYNELLNKFKTLKENHKSLMLENKMNAAEFKRYKKYSKSLEFALNSINGEKVDEQSQKDSLANQLSMVNKALLETDKENNELKANIFLLEETLFEIKEELKLEKSKAKQHLRINKSMENELFRLNHELEQQQYLN
jgi:chromosome segregation ATPase